MALRFMDSFDHYGASEITKKWTAAVSPEIAAGNARFGAQGLRLNQLTGQRSVTKVLDAQQTWVFGFALWLEGFGTQDFWRLMDGGTVHASMRMTSAGLIQLSRGASGAAVLGTGITPFSLSAWYYVEVRVKIDDSAGEYEVKVNEISQFSGTGADTRNAGNASADRFMLLGSGDDNSTGPKRFDDLYVCDGTGSAPTNTFLGDLRIQCIVPSGNGNSSVLVGSDGNSTDNYLLVDETTSPSDADYVESSTPGDKDTYAYGDLTPTSGTVYGVMPLLRALKTDAGTRSIVSVARLSGTEVDGPVQTLSTTSLYYPDIRETKPGGGAWSISDVNSAEFGVKINA